MITAFPKIDLLVGLWSYNGPAIRDALKASGKAGRVKAVAFDEEEEMVAPLLRVDRISKRFPGSGSNHSSSRWQGC